MLLIWKGGKPKKVIGEIFNKDKVIESTQAERVAKQQLGNDAAMKGWKIEAHNGKVLYYDIIKMVKSSCYSRC